MNRKYLLAFIVFALKSYEIVVCSAGSSGSAALLDNFSWECANNASCLNSLASNVLGSLNKKESVNFGIFSIEPMPEKPITIEGRSSKILDFLSGNAVRVPIGPMIFSVQRSDDYENYVEVALLKKSSEQGRRQHNNRISRREKKHMQILIPMFLAANAIGWTLLAVKAVGVLTMKALLVSKLALVIAAGVILKKLMESASEKMMLARYPEHHEQPFMMPYNMEYAIPAHALHSPEIAANELYMHMANPHEMVHSGMGSLGAESSLSHAIEVQNGTQPQLIAAMAAASVPKVKREDTSQWTGIRKKPTIYNYLTPKSPVYVYRKV